MSAMAVVQAGARTAIGLDARQTGFLLRAGLPAMGEAPLASAAGEPITMAFVPTLDPSSVGPERLGALARPALEEAVAPIRDLAADVHLVIDERCGSDPQVRATLERAVQRVMPSANLKLEARGEAAPAAILPAALRALERQTTEAVVLGGVHSDYDPAAIAELEASERLFAPDNLDARIPGEAAAFVVLMRPSHASRHGLEPLARIVGVGSGQDRTRPDNDEEAYQAFGTTAAVRTAAQPLADAGQTAGWILNDLTTEMWRLYEWEAAFVRNQKVLGRPYHIESPAQRIGYLGAAAMPLFMAMAATAWQHGYAPSPTALATAASDSGERAALVLSKP